MSYYYGKRSRANLDTVDSMLVQVFETAIQHVDITILEGHRGQVWQNELAETGKSPFRYPNSEHNSVPSRAIDFAPYPIVWEDADRFRALAYYLRGIANAQGLLVRLGCDWNGNFSHKDQKFHDLGHIEILE